MIGNMTHVKIVHEFTNDLHRLLGLVVIHGNANGIRRQTQGMRTNIQPPKVIVGLLQKLFDEFMIFTCATPDCKYNLHP